MFILESINNYIQNAFISQGHYLKQVVSTSGRQQKVFQKG